MLVPAELQRKIIEQVEWYFSDENLLKDSFLMKHIHRNKQGFVSLKLVASFRKVKSLTKDWRVVQASLLHSSQLQLNSDRNKVRRRAPVPELDYSHTYRTVIVQNYPDPLPLTEEIEREFSKYGEVTLVRILSPGSAVPMDVKPSRKRHPAIGESLCILVEFESEDGAKRACRRFPSQQSWRDQNQMEVALLSKKENGEEVNGKTREGKKPDGGQMRFLSPSKSPGHKNAAGYTSPVNAGSRRRQKGSPAASRKYLSPDTSQEKEYLSDSSCSVGRARSPRLSPGPIRKFPSDQALTRSYRNAQESRLIRQPWGPDGSRGFLKTMTALPVVSIAS